MLEFTHIANRFLHPVGLDNHAVTLSGGALNHRADDMLDYRQFALAPFEKGKILNRLKGNAFMAFPMIMQSSPGRTVE